MRVGIVGAGAIGSLFAEQLSSVAEVQVLRREGDPQMLGGADFVLVAVKTHATVEALRRLRNAIAATTPIVSLQNGIDQIAHVDEALGVRQPVALAPTTHGAILDAGGRAIRTGRGLTMLGWARGRAGRQLESLHDMLLRADLEAQIADPIEPWVWGKLVANAAINPLTALAGVSNGAILSDGALHARAVRLAVETAAVAAAGGVKLPFDDPVAYVESVARATAFNRSSMLVDLETGRPTEIEAINGAVHRLGLALGVPTPENERVLDEVRARAKA